jgi:hypothetical protein
MAQKPLNALHYTLGHSQTLQEIRSCYKGHPPLAKQLWICAPRPQNSFTEYAHGLRDGPLFFWRGGDGYFVNTKQFFLAVVVIANNFFAPASFCKQFFLSI